MEFGVHLPLMDFGGILRPRSSHRVHRDCCATRLQRTVGERPHGVFGTLARRAGSAGGGDGALRENDAGHDGRARSGAWTGCCRQDVGRRF